MENSPAGLVMLEPAVAVTVTREEHHQQALARYPIDAEVAVELAWCRISNGKYRGERAVEVRLDGQRVGELTHAMSQRYGALVDAVAARGGRPGCEAHVFLGKRGVEIELRLPRETNLAAALPPMTAFPPYPVAAPAAYPTSMAPARVIPPPQAPRKKTPWPVWAAASAVGVVLFAAVIGSGDDSKPAGSSATTLAATSTTTTTTTTTTSTTVPPVTTLVPTTVVEAPAAPAPQAATAAPAPTTTRRPAPTTTKPPVAAPPPPPAPVPVNKCDPNYSGCVPIASDVDCAGGKGNGPAYVKGPIQVIGTDIYDLDRDGDGTACD